MARVGTVFALVLFGATPSNAHSVDRIQAAVNKAVDQAGQLSRKVGQHTRRLHALSSSKQGSSNRRLEGSTTCSVGEGYCHLSAHVVDNVGWEDLSWKMFYNEQFHCESLDDAQCEADGNCRVEATGCSLDAEKHGVMALVDSSGCGIMGDLAQADAMCSQGDASTCLDLSPICGLSEEVGVVDGREMECVEQVKCLPDPMKVMCPGMPDRTDDESATHYTNCGLTAMTQNMTQNTDPTAMLHNLTMCIYEGCSEAALEMFTHVAMLNEKCDSATDCNMETDCLMENMQCSPVDNLLPFMMSSMSEGCKLRSFMSLTGMCDMQCTLPWCAQYEHFHCDLGYAQSEMTCGISTVGGMVAFARDGMNDALLVGNMMFLNSECGAHQSEQECLAYAGPEDPLSFEDLESILDNMTMIVGPGGGGGRCVRVSEGDVRAFDMMGLRVRDCASHM